MKKISILPLIAFVSGFSLMVFELAAARVLAPSIGSSTYVWTSVIGVIIAALSLGYFAGGKIADARNQKLDVAIICLAISGSITLTLLSYIGLIDWTVQMFDDARIQGVVASLLLFAPSSFLIGSLSPYLVKLRVTSLDTSGQSFASLSALESIGGIVGTFITGFILFGYIGAREAFGVVILILIGSSWLIVPAQKWKFRCCISLGILVVCSGALLTPNSRQIDTASAHYTIVEGTYQGDRLRGIASGPSGTQSGVSLLRPDSLVFWYTQKMAEVVAAAPARDRILVLGGGAYTLPRYLATLYPESVIDVVEIDPELADISRRYFFYDDPENINMIFSDARSYINQTKQVYDLILVDVYSDTSVPFSMTTKEYGQAIARRVTENGSIVANVIAGERGSCKDLLTALDAPYRQQFSDILYKIERPESVKSNMIVSYSRQPLNWSGAKRLELPASTPYTDNYAPIERLQQRCLTTSRTEE